MVLEPRTDHIVKGCDGSARGSAGRSMNHFSSVVNKAYTVKYR